MFVYLIDVLIRYGFWFTLTEVIQVEWFSAPSVQPASLPNVQTLPVLSDRLIDVQPNQPA